MGVTKLKGQSVNGGDCSDCDGDNNDNDNSDNEDDDDALSKADISQAQAKCSIIFGVEKYKEYAERVPPRYRSTGATGEGYRPKEAGLA